jgi:hypothetical protein
LIGGYQKKVTATQCPPKRNSEVTAAVAAESPIDWRSEQIAAHRWSPCRSRHSRRADVSYMVPKLEDQIDRRPARSVEPATVGVIDRPAWIEANISFRHLIEPAIEQWADRSTLGGHDDQRSDRRRRLGAARMDEQPGAQPIRLLVGRDDLDDAVYMVGPTAGLEKRFGFDRSSSERGCRATSSHRAQFTGVPWMRETCRTGQHQHPLRQPRSSSLAGAIRDAHDRRARRQVRDAVFGRSRHRAARGDQQIAGLMSLLEGHGDVTMSRAVSVCHRRCLRRAASPSAALQPSVG